MELTTRCPECETVFPVSLEQLQVRKGYIRCIQCAHIFDGFDAALPAETPRPGAQGAAKPPAVEPTMPPLPASADAGRAAAPEELPAHKGFIIPPADRVPMDGPQPARPFSIGHERGASAGQAAPDEPSISAKPPFVSAQEDKEPRIPSVLRQRGDMRARSAPGGPSFTISEPAARAAGRRGEPILSTDVDGERPFTAGARTGPAHLAAGTPENVPDDEAAADDYLFIEPRAGRRSARYKPEFMGDARRERAWMTPVWAILIVGGLVLLGLQGVYVYRSQLANAFPGLRPTLEAACGRLGCSVPYERRIEAIAITGSALRSSGAPDGDVSNLVLEVTLRNAYERPQEWPTLVLDLKDASGTVVVRRNLLPEVWVPADLNDGPFAAESEIRVQLPVAVRGLQANGYQLDKFFP